MGWVVSIPVFCDSGFVVLNPVRRALAQRTLTSPVALTVGLSAGLFTSHNLIPPTPGPIAAAEALGLGNELLIVILLGALVSIPVMIAAYFFASYIGRKVVSAETAELTDDDVEAAYNQLRDSYATLPSTSISFAPIVVPILAMAAGTIASMTGLEGPVGDGLLFIGTPMVALALGTVLAVVVLYQVTEKNTAQEFYDLTEQALKVVGPILFITAAGSALGKVISNTDMLNFIEENAGALASMGVFFPFLLAAILKTAQGSSTVALVTASNIVAPTMGALGMETPLQIGLGVMAVAAGAMMVSHANDSYFWVVTNFSGMTPQQGYRTQTVLTGIMGVTAIVFIWILSLFIF